MVATVLRKTVGGSTVDRVNICWSADQMRIKQLKKVVQTGAENVLRNNIVIP
jgi:hypothetical protein